VTARQATITQSRTNTTIIQVSARSAIDWTSLNIARDANVDFVQPTSHSVALNRVVGQDTSQIFGALRANGQVVIMNPNGVLFAPVPR
jgi:filamentous hemagglutinin family protein